MFSKSSAGNQGDEKRVYLVGGAEGETSETEEDVLSFEFWVLSYLSRAWAKETRETKETR